MPALGVIGGSGLYEISGMTVLKDVALNTPFGHPSGPYRVGLLSGKEVAFLPRHGLRHQFAPDRINYRANLWGFKELGIERIISVSAAGGINPSLKPGDLVLLDQIIDFTQAGRASTFYDKDKTVHIDLTDPYCPELLKLTALAGKTTGTKTNGPFTYVCVNGPRLETRAEIKFFAQIGGDVVGMTAMPEAALARELEICFAGIVVVTNPAAGISAKKLTTSEVVREMRKSTEDIKAILRGIVPLLPEGRRCSCGTALKDSMM